MTSLSPACYQLYPALPHARVESTEVIYTAGVIHRPQVISVRIVKRLIDLCVATLALLLAGWLFPLIAMAIVLDSRGPILYRQRRAGAFRGRAANGQPLFSEFEILKFRTMVVDAEKRTGVVLAAENDSRITRVGRLLRRTRLDELPQLISVLRGDMTLVGPRPERPELLSHLMDAIPFFEERLHGVKPGITGFAQVSLGYSGHALPGSDVALHEADLVNPFGIDEARNAPADDMRLKLLYDLAYVAALENFWSFIKLELYVIVKTPWVMLLGLGR